MGHLTSQCMNVLKDKDGKETKVKVDKDDGCRPETTVEGLGKLKPAF